MVRSSQLMATVDAKLEHVGAVRCRNIDDVYEVVPSADGAPPDLDASGRPDPGLLGSGSYGLVRRRRKRCPSGGDNTANPVVAVKELKKDPLCSHPEVLVHTLVELSVLKCVQHRGCIRVVDLLHSSETLYVVTPLFGSTLYNAIIADGAFSLHNTALVIKQLLDVLSYLHTQLMIVHRDVKPENILISTDSMRIKLIDFGLAKFIGKPKASETSLLPSPGIAVTPGTCTTAYASLEVIDAMLNQHGKPPSSKWTSGRSGLTKVDIYAAGVVCYTMLFKCLPFAVRPDRACSKQSLMELKASMKRGVRFPPMAQHFPSQHCLAFIMELMHTNPASRPSAADALRHRYLVNISVPDFPKTPGQRRTTHEDPNAGDSQGDGSTPQTPPGADRAAESADSPSEDGEGKAGAPSAPAQPIKTVAKRDDKQLKIGAVPKKRGRRAGPCAGPAKSSPVSPVKAPEGGVDVVAGGVGGGVAGSAGEGARPVPEVEGQGEEEAGCGGGGGGGVYPATTDSEETVFDYTAVPSPSPLPDPNCDFKGGWRHIIDTVAEDEDEPCDFT